jgi:hypothetical protein
MKFSRASRCQDIKILQRFGDYFNIVTWPLARENVIRKKSFTNAAQKFGTNTEIFLAAMTMKV